MNVIQFPQRVAPPSNAEESAGAGGSPSPVSLAPADNLIELPIASLRKVLCVMDEHSAEALEINRRCRIAAQEAEAAALERRAKELRALARS